MANKNEVLICENGCTPKDLYGNEIDTPFFYPGSVIEMETQIDESIGVLAYNDAEPSNRWEDGTAGVPEKIQQACRDYSELPSCIHCGGQVIRVTTEKAADLRAECEEN